MRPSVQAPAAVVMLRPHHFTVNTQTAHDNAFQAQMNVQGSDLSRRAYDEHTVAMAELERHGVCVHVFEGTDTATPDCVFPNTGFRPTRAAMWPSIR